MRPPGSWECATNTVLETIRIVKRRIAEERGGVADWRGMSDLEGCDTD